MAKKVLGSGSSVSRRTVTCTDKGTDAGLRHTTEAIWDLRAVQSLGRTSGYSVVALMRSQEWLTQTRGL